MRIEKDIDLTGLLTRISKSGLQIKSVNTEEPTLEEAFNAIINHGNSSVRNQEEANA